MGSLRALAVLACIGLIWLLRPFVTVRIGSLFVSRLGHLAGNTECYLCERDAGINKPKGRVLDIWAPVGEPANAYLLKMFSRVLYVSQFAGLVSQAAGRFKWWKGHTFTDSQWGRDIHNLMEWSPPHLRLTRREERRGQKGLRELGIPDGAKWVCIIARDPIYLKVKEPGADYSYHDFRDSDINTYREAAVALMERGYYVIRMGVHVDGPMKLQAPQFIDYAVSGKRSEFMDIYLGAKCAFTISNGAGFDGIPMIFRRPICFVNEAPFEYLSTWMAGSLAIWKHHYAGSNRLSPARIVECGAGLFSTAKQYADAGIVLVPNTPEEIKDVALEISDYLDGLIAWNKYWSPQPFWDAFPRSMSPHNGKPLHGRIRLRIGTKFLQSYE